MFRLCLADFFDFLQIWALFHKRPQFAAEKRKVYGCVWILPVGLPYGMPFPMECPSLLPMCHHSVWFSCYILLPSRNCFLLLRCSHCGALLNGHCW